jgi:hypothetical protein
MADKERSKPCRICKGIGHIPAKHDPNIKSVVPHFKPCPACIGKVKR